MVRGLLRVFSGVGGGGSGGGVRRKDEGGGREGREFVEDAE